MKTTFFCITILLFTSSIICFGQSPSKVQPLTMVIIETVEPEIFRFEYLKPVARIELSTINISVINNSTEVVLDNCFGFMKPTFNAKKVAPIEFQNFIRSPRRDISIITRMGGIVEQIDGTFSIKGARNAPLVFIDGVKTRGNITVPIAAINYVETIKQSLGADIGDTDGGAIFIQSRNAYAR